MVFFAAGQVVSGNKEHFAATVAGCFQSGQWICTEESEILKGVFRSWLISLAAAAERDYPMSKNLGRSILGGSRERPKKEVEISFQFTYRHESGSKQLCFPIPPLPFYSAAAYDSRKQLASFSF